STLHLWWARRPLVASRAAVFAALVRADAQPQITDPDTGQPMTITKFMIELCKWELRPEILEEARRLIREAYPDSPPKVLDMFAGGGSIPLEALRLGAEAYALDLNPVAHIIQLATLVYPQKYGPQLAEDVRKWGEWVLEQVRAEVGDLYPLIPDPEFTPEQAQRQAAAGKHDRQLRLLPSDEPEQLEMDFTSPPDPLSTPGEGEDDEDSPDGTSAEVPFGYLQPVAYLWTRAVTCPNPACRATVPLVRQTWLKKKKGDNVALAMTPHPHENRMAFTVRHARDPQDFGFDPAGFSQRGNSVCGRCGTTVTSDYVKQEGKAGRMSAQMMATVCVRPVAKGKVYLSPDEHDLPLPDGAAIQARIETLTAETGITPPDEELVDDPRNVWVYQYGFTRWQSIYTVRQLLTLLTIANQVRLAHFEMGQMGIEVDRAKAITSYLGLALSRLSDFCSSLCVLYADGGRGVTRVFVRQSLPMVWDYAETNPFNPNGASWQASLNKMLDAFNSIYSETLSAKVLRGSATSVPLRSGNLDAVITDPPYYDNVSYADLSDYFYVW
ncbi:MAG: DUF1156 domain-containing protein, partial [Anaerolineae bacterium]|nr:DUF1156 domain-containing protein [Anaerolineae bacterium]